jgi:hypothetical protein
VTVVPFDKRKPPLVVKKKPPRQVVPMPASAPQPQRLHNPPQWTLPPDIDTETPYGKAKIVLRGRVWRTSEDFFLDGKRVGFYTVIREANGILKQAGMQQINCGPECFM